MNLFVVILVMILVCTIILDIKIDNAYRNCSILLEAMCLYNIDVITSVDYDKDKKYLIDYEEHLGNGALVRALFRLFDWGYTNILPQDVFERIVPYLDDAERIFDQKYAKRK